jgi:hypothetical protein
MLDRIKPPRQVVFPAGNRWPAYFTNKRERALVALEIVIDFAKGTKFEK